MLFKEISVYIDLLSKERSSGMIPTGTWVEPIYSNFENVSTDKIKRIGIVGVFDNPDSTNIPFAKAFQKAGYSVDVFNYRSVANEIGIHEMNAELEKFASNFDLIIICKGNGIYPETIALCSSKTNVCWYFMDALIHLENDPAYYDMARAADSSVVTTNEVLSALNAASICNVHHIIQGIDPLQFRPIKFNGEKICDIVFIGQATPKRMKILTELPMFGITGRAYGPGFNAQAYGEKFNTVCAEGRILLAINNTDSSEDSFSDRILRYMATDGCVVTEYSKGLEKYFVNGKHLAWPVGNETLVDVIQKYLAHPKMRKQMANAGYQYVIENHTWDKIAEKIIKITEGIGNEKENI